MQLLHIENVGFLDGNADAILKLVVKNILNLFNWRDGWERASYEQKKDRASKNGHQHWAPGSGPSYNLDMESPPKHNTKLTEGFMVMHQIIEFTRLAL